MTPFTVEITENRSVDDGETRLILVDAVDHASTDRTNYTTVDTDGRDATGSKVSALDGERVARRSSAVRYTSVAAL